MVITAGQFAASGGGRTRVDQVEIDGQHYLRYTHADGRMEYRRLTPEQVDFLEGQANMREALKNYNGPIAP